MNEDLLRAAFDALPLGVVVADPSGETVLRNRRARALAAARHSDAIAARALDDLLALAAGGPQRRTLELHGPPPRMLDLTAEPVTEDDDLLGVVAVLHDVSERHRVDAVRRDFVANVSHELRTPVGALRVLAETLQDERDIDVAHRLAARILTEADRATRIIEDLLDLSRIEAEGVQVRRRVPVADLLAEAAERVAPAAQRCEVTLDVALPDDGVEVVGDDRQLVSAFANLLDNAVKYSEPGRTVSVRVSHDEEWLDVAVADQGAGIPAKDLARIFERFYRVDRARSRATGGTGLGLAIVRHVVANHAGDVRVESREGEGSTFTVRLPWARG
ncbi:MAG TPA: ATP-binding protein [Mycobacteriales bacterium]|jgi:two-component system sensor histidine kinase SenX3|nr:ATP-binding protein [Mycobacteriales bacterium]